MTSPPTASRSRRVKRFWGRVLKIFLGVVFCQNPFTSLLVVGWTYRLMRRWITQRWVGLAGKWGAIEPVEVQWEERGRWPNWVLEEPRKKDQPQSWENEWAFIRCFRRLTGSFFLNLKTGFQGLVNTWVLTLPAGALWQLSWDAGWNNSFAKGYEQSHVGPLVGIFGIVLFIAAMLYVPLAQARQAATGKMTSFFQFGVIWAVVRRKWGACLILAAATAVVALPVNLIKLLPTFLPQPFPVLSTQTPQESLAFLRTYFFWTTFVGFPAYLLVHFLAVRIYASGLAELAALKDIPLEKLDPWEMASLESLGLLRPVSRPRRHAFLQVLGWAATRTGRLVSLGGMVFFWFLFTAQIFISQFLAYHPFRWMNHPLVQLPYFRYIPAQLEEAAQAISPSAAKK